MCYFLSWSGIFEVLIIIWPPPSPRNCRHISNKLKFLVAKQPLSHSLALSFSNTHSFHTIWKYLSPKLAISFSFTFYLCAFPLFHSFSGPFIYSYLIILLSTSSCGPFLFSYTVILIFPCYLAISFPLPLFISFNPSFPLIFSYHAILFSPSSLPILPYSFPSSYLAILLSPTSLPIVILSLSFPRPPFYPPFPFLLSILLSPTSLLIVILALSFPSLLWVPFSLSLSLSLLPSGT